jgi:hypothetical protein
LRLIQRERHAQKHPATYLPEVQKTHAVLAAQEYRRPEISVPRLRGWRPVAVPGSRQASQRCVATFGLMPVQEYRAYTVGIDGHFIGFEPLVCRDDGEAVAKAKRLVDGHDIEVWNGERLVVRLKSSPTGLK